MVTFLIPGSLAKITLARAHQNLQSTALGLTKTSFAMTLLRLFPKGWEYYLIWGLVISMNAQFFAHIIATWQPVCGTPDEAHMPVKCWNLQGTVTFAVFSACMGPHVKVFRSAEVLITTSLLGRLRLHSCFAPVANDLQPPNEEI